MPHVIDSPAAADAAVSLGARSQTAYTCPQCKGPLVALACAHCGVSYPAVEGIPSFLQGASTDQSTFVREVYDAIYSHHEDVWADQGRSQEFMVFFGGLVRSLAHGSLLEVGCGEGKLLAALPGERKFGIDPSIHALLRAKSRSAARFAVALAEDLPFPNAAFDVVVSVGVMEHFADPDAATAEIHRVLLEGGHYVVLIHTDMTRAQRLGLKFREFFVPRFRPLAFASWLKKKLWRPIRQPLRKSYTIESARECLERNGLRVKRILSQRTDPLAPLAGEHVVIFVAQKAAS
jgi:SAM-dependent methyltransferase